MKKKAAVILLALLVVFTSAACSSKRQIDVDQTGSERVQGTSWYRFCDGPNAFIWVKGYTDGEPDELEAVIYDHWACVDADQSNDVTAPDTTERDDDGVVEDEDDH